MSGTYNISPGYDLAQRTVKSVYGLTGYFDYPGPSYLGPVDASFLRKTGFPHKVSLLHDFLFDLEWEGVESELSVLPPAENIDFWSSYMRMSGLDCPEWMCEKEIGSYGTELRLAAKEEWGRW